MMYYIIIGFAVAVAGLGMLALEQSETIGGMEVVYNSMVEANEINAKNIKKKEALLVERDHERSKLRDEVGELKSSLAMEEENNEETRQYMDTSIPTAVYERLQQQITVSDNSKVNSTTGVDAAPLPADSLWPDEQASSQLRDRPESQSSGLLQGQGRIEGMVKG